VNKTGIYYYEMNRRHSDDGKRILKNNEINV